MSQSFLQTLRTSLQTDGAAILPELELILFVAGILAIDRWLAVKEKIWNAWLALGGLVFSGLTLWTLRAQVAARGGMYGFRDSLLVDSYFLFFGALLLAGVALVIVLWGEAPEIRPEKSARNYSLLLLATAGMLVMLSATNLLTILLGVEIMSFSCYFLSEARVEDVAESVTARWSRARIWGPRIAASVFIVSGLVVLYRTTGSTNIGDISVALGHRSDLARAIALANQPGPRGEGMRQLLQARMPEALRHHFFSLQTLPMCALVLIGLGLFLKVATSRAKHLANVNSEAPNPFAAFAQIAGATASFALLLRLLLTVFASSQDSWLYIAEIASLLILTSASIVAVFQTNLRRILACAALAQFGFVLLGLVSANETGVYGITFYVLSYVFALAGVYVALGLLQQNDGVAERVEDVRGLYRRNPGDAVVLAVLLFSLAGIPGTSGFLGKYAMVRSVIEMHHWRLAVASIVLFLPTLWVLLRLAREAFRRAPAEQPRLALSNGEAIALGICLFVTLAAGLYAEPFQRLAHYAFGQ
jgi:NADH-quinone oxidoreductase subunit N